MEGAGSTEGQSSGGLRVATLNLWGRNGTWEERRSVLIDGLRELQPDLVALQEAVVADGYDQVADLLGAGYHVVHHGGRTEDGSGLSIASRWEVGEVWERTLRVTSRADPSGVAIAEIPAPDPFGRTLLFAHHNAAWQLGFERERELQAVAASCFVEDLLRERGADHVILAGDFNATPESAGVRFWTGRQSLGDASVCYRDVWECSHPGEAGHTFSPTNPLVTAGEWSLETGRRIDYVMVRCGQYGPTLEVASCERIFDEPVGGTWASDHFGVVADLTVPKPGPTAAYDMT